MFGFPRLETLMTLAHVHRPLSLIDDLISSLTVFTGSEWEQEDDLTLLTVQREAQKDTCPKERIEDLPQLSGSGYIC